MRWFRRRRPREPQHIDLAVDADGNRYTTHAFAAEGDPWYGATILTPGQVDRLREEGRLPLTEVVMPRTRIYFPGEDRPTDYVGEPEVRTFDPYPNKPPSR